MPEQELAWFPVRSSNLDAVAYDQTSSTLYVRFKTGATWAYSNVPMATYTTLIISPSVGRFFAAQIKGQFQGSQT